MQKAFEFLGPIGTALASVLSFLMLWTGIRAAIGRLMHTETRETLARIDENVKMLVSQMNTLHEDSRALREDFRAIRGDIKAIRGDIKAIRGDIKAIRGDIKAISEEVSTLRKGVSSLGENCKALRDDLRQLGDKIGNTTSGVYWLHGFCTVTFVSPRSQTVRRNRTARRNRLESLTKEPPLAATGEGSGRSAPKTS